jgi:hypothetical protein
LRFAYDAIHALRIGHTVRRQRTGVKVYENEDAIEKYERNGSSTMSYIVLAVLVAVVCLIAGLAVWTSA